MLGSVSSWLEAFRSGDRDAADQLWQRYYENLVRASRARLGSRALQSSDEEDIAAFAFERCLNGLQEGRFPNLLDRHDLWRVLLHIAAQRVQELHRTERRLKRFPPTNGAKDDPYVELDELIGNTPSPDLVVASTESMGKLLEALDDGVLRETAVLKLEGLSNPQIARRLGCSLATVERKLKRIRHEWSRRIDLRE